MAYYLMPDTRSWAAVVAQPRWTWVVPQWPTIRLAPPQSQQQQLLPPQQQLMPQSQLLPPPQQQQLMPQQQLLPQSQLLPPQSQQQSPQQLMPQSQLLPPPQQQLLPPQSQQQLLPPPQSPQQMPFQSLPAETLQVQSLFITELYDKTRAWEYVKISDCSFAEMCRRLILQTNMTDLHRVTNIMASLGIRPDIPDLLIQDSLAKGVPDYDRALARVVDGTRLYLCALRARRFDLLDSFRPTAEALLAAARDPAEMRRIADLSWFRVTPDMLRAYASAPEARDALLRAPRANLSDEVLADFLAWLPDEAMVAVVRRYWRAYFADRPGLLPLIERGPRAAAILDAVRQHGHKVFTSIWHD
jgi:hypothetical protein